MPKVFNKSQKIKIVEYNAANNQGVSFKNIANDVYKAVRKLFKTA